MYSPMHTFPSDFSTPKPEFVSRSEDFNNEEFSRFLNSLVDDINALGKQTESLRNENLILNKQIEVLQKEKDKHVKMHAKEKFDLEKTLAAEVNSKKMLIKELKFYKEKCESLERKRGIRDVSSEKSLRSKKSDSGIKNKISKMEKEQRVIQKKIKELESGSYSKSGVIRWEDDY